MFIEAIHHTDFKSSYRFGSRSKFGEVGIVEEEENECIELCGEVKDDCIGPTIGKTELKSEELFL